MCAPPGPRALVAARFVCHTRVCYLPICILDTPLVRKHTKYYEKWRSNATKNRKYKKLFCTSGAFQTVSCRYENMRENKIGFAIAQVRQLFNFIEASNSLNRSSQPNNLNDCYPSLHFSLNKSLCSRCLVQYHSHSF